MIAIPVKAASHPHKRRRLALLAAVGALLLGASQGVLAAMNCAATPVIGPDIRADRLVIQPGLPVGTILYTYTLERHIDCTGTRTDDMLRLYPDAGAVAHHMEGQYYFHPDMAHLGLRVVDDATGRVLSTAGWPTMLDAKDLSLGRNTLRHRYEIFYTGERQGHSTWALFFGLVAQHWANNGLVANFMRGATFEFQTVNTTCYLSDPPPVRLANVSDADLPIPGSGAKPESFSVSMQCLGAGQPAPVFLTLTDALSPGNRTEVLEPDPSQTSRGVGLQISRGSTFTAPIRLGQKWKEGDFTAATHSLQFTARYIRTGEVSVGNVRGAATLTLNYE
jgi:type 1 fimbria pilin